MCSRGAPGGGKPPPTPRASVLRGTCGMRGCPLWPEDETGGETVSSEASWPALGQLMEGREAGKIFRGG